MSMKYLVIAIIIAGFVSNCRKQDREDHDRLSITDKQAFNDMQAAYGQAKLYNDSLVHCAGTANPCSPEYIAYCDSIYHHHEGEWNDHHDRYSHDNEHDDHHHDMHGMHHHGNYGEHNYSEGHHEYHHERMEQLMDDHQPYHP